MTKTCFPVEPVPARVGDLNICRSKGLLISRTLDPEHCIEIGPSSNSVSDMVRIPYQDRFNHTLIFGATGCGKSTKLMLPMVRQDIETTDAAVIFIDGKGDVCESAVQAAKEHGRKVFYFNPTSEDCPFFNPLVGTEDEAVEAVAAAFLAMEPNSPQFFKDVDELLVSNCVKVLKRLDKAKGIDGKYATLLNLSLLVHDYDRGGRHLIQKFSCIASAIKEEATENANIASWFINEYYENRGNIYENTSGVRARLVKIFNTPNLRRILNPDINEGEANQLDFERCFAEKMVMCVTGSGGILGTKGVFLDVLIEQKLKQAIARRSTKSEGSFLYIDEFQAFSGFCDVLPHLKEKQIALHAAMMTRRQLPETARNVVDGYMSNIIGMTLMPQDAAFYAVRLNAFYQTLAEIRGETWENETTKIREKLMAVDGNTVFHYRMFGGKRADPGLGTIFAVDPVVAK